MDERTITGYSNRSYTMAWNNTNDPDCMVNGYDASRGSATYGSLSSSGGYVSTFFFAIDISENRCGISVESNNDYIYYSQSVIVTYGHNPNDFIEREEVDVYHAACFLNRTAEKKLERNSLNVSYRAGEETGSKFPSDFVFLCTLSFTSFRILHNAQRRKMMRSEIIISTTLQRFA